MSPAEGGDGASVVWSSARRGVAAARAHVLPGCVLGALGCAVLAAWHLHPPSRAALEHVAAWRVRGGYAFAVVSTALFGGLVPLLLQGLRTAGQPRERWRHLPFFLGYWGYKGAEVAAIYEAQALLFGATPSLRVVALKVAVDQLLILPLWGLPTFLLPYRWKDSGFSWRVFRTGLDRRWLIATGLPLLLSGWALWLPAVVLIYSLPLPLQLPLQNLVLAFAVLIGALLARGEPARRGGADPPPDS